MVLQILIDRKIATLQLKIYSEEFLRYKFTPMFRYEQ